MQIKMQIRNSLEMLFWGVRVFYKPIFELHCIIKISFMCSSLREPLFGELMSFRAEKVRSTSQVTIGAFAIMATLLGSCPSRPSQSSLEPLNSLAIFLKLPRNKENLLLFSKSRQNPKKCKSTCKTANKPKICKYNYLPTIDSSTYQLSLYF